MFPLNILHSDQHAASIELLLLLLFRANRFVEAGLGFVLDGTMILINIHSTRWCVRVTHVLVQVRTCHESRDITQRDTRTIHRSGSFFRGS